MVALSGQGAPPHTQMVASLGLWANSPKTGPSVGLVQAAHGIFYTLHQMFTFELPASHLDVILQQDFCTKMVNGSGVGRGKGTHILLRGIYAVPFIHRYTNRAFLRLSGAGWGWDI